MATTFEQMETALTGWLRTSTGAAFRWDDQKAPQPGEVSGTPVSYGTMRILTVTRLGMTAGAVRSVDMTRPAGQEVKTSMRMPCLLSFRAQLFTADTVGAASAFPLLQVAAARLDLDSVSGELARGGLGVATLGTVQNLSGLIGTRYQGHAAFDVSFNCTTQVADFVGYFLGVRLTANVEP